MFSQICRWNIIILFYFQVCFETIDPLTIKKVVDNKATYYSRIDAIPGWTKTEETEYVLGISIWIDETPALRKYEFQVDRSAKYVPITGYEMTDVRLVENIPSKYFIKATVW